jgi:hypothetical protein
MTIGPATVMASVKMPVSGPADARLRYVIPARICGTAHLPLAKGVKAVPPGTPPFVNAQKVAPCAGELRDKTSSALMLDAELLIVIAGSGLMFRFEPAGQEVMKPAARVKTFCTPRGVSNADGTATALAAVRMNV